MNNKNNKIIRARTNDSFQTYDSAYQAMDSSGNQRGKVFDHEIKYRDGKFYDSTGAMLVGELERMDLTMHMPLAAVTWRRDIDLREDVTIADDVSSFTLSSFSSAGGLGQGQGVGTGKSWAGKNTNQVSTNSVDISKVATVLTPWEKELKYTIYELESAAKVGRPIDQQKFEAMKLTYEMDIDEQVYLGDTSLGFTGLCNSALVGSYGTSSSVPAGVSGSTTWARKTPDEILADFNLMLQSTWAASAYAVLPKKILLPPSQFGLLSSMKVSQAGNESVLNYIMERNLTFVSTGQKLIIQPLKWLAGSTDTGVATMLNNGSLDRAVVYSQEKQFVRFPMTTLSRTPVQYDGTNHKTTYFGKLGAVEVVYPETISYYDGV